jgi:hypothetical protein
VPSVQFTSSATYTHAANFDFYVPFFVTKALTVDMAGFEVTTGPASSSIVYMAVYAADDNLQPTGSPLINVSQTVGTSATGLFRVQATPATLQPGAYLMAMNNSVQITYRSLRGGWITGSNFGTDTYNVVLREARTAGSFGSNPSAYTSRLASNAPGFIEMFLRWKAA